MVYTNYDEQISLLSTHQWITLQGLTTYLYKLTEFLMERFDNRDARSHIPQLTSYMEVPISKTERFPEFERMLCCCHGKWKAELDLLQLSIDVMVHSNRLARQYPDYKTEGEAEHYAVTKIHNILQLLQKDSFQRLGFEFHFDLKWEEFGSDNK